MYFDEECIQLFDAAASRSGLSLSSFLQNAGMMSLLNRANLLDAGFCIVPKDAAGRPPAHAAQAAPKPPAKKKKTYSLKKETELFDAFVYYLGQRLQAVDTGKFFCRYALNPDNCYSWMPQTLYCGESREENAQMLAFLRQQLLWGMDSGDERHCYEVVCCAMDWGHVLYTSGICKGNKVRVDRYDQNHDLLPLLKRSRDHLKNHEFELLEECSSGWSLIWYLIDIQHLLILSSRKVYALNRILQDFCAEKQLSELPKSLNFGQLVYQGSSKYIEGVRYVYTLKAKLGLLEKVSRVVNRLMDSEQFADTKDVDDRLYVLGEG